MISKWTKSKIWSYLNFKNIFSSYNKYIYTFLEIFVYILKFIKLFNYNFLNIS